MRRFALLGSLCLLLCAGGLSAQTYPERQDGFLNDYADLLSTTAEQDLVYELEILAESTGVEMVVVTLPRLADYAQGQTLETFATGLFNTWGIGDPEYNDGVMILVAQNERVMRIELGAAYGRDWDAVAVDLIARNFRPAFADDDWATGLLEGTASVTDWIVYPHLDGERAVVPGFDPIWLVVLAALGIAAYSARQTVSQLFVRVMKCPDCGRRSLSQRTEILSQPAAQLRGQARIMRTCANCGFAVKTLVVLPETRMGFGSNRSGGSGGGSSGGGGGSGSF